MSKYYGAIGSDGRSLVFWGVGTSPSAAKRDAKHWLALYEPDPLDEAGHSSKSIRTIAISPAQYRSIKMGNADAADAEESPSAVHEYLRTRASHSR